MFRNSDGKLSFFFPFFIPELSSFTSDDIVLVMESAAMSRSFLKFLRGPWREKKKSFQIWLHTACNKRKQTEDLLLCYLERRPLERPLPRPWVSPEVCESGLCWQSLSGSVWESTGWWCGWGRNVESQDPESEDRTGGFSVRQNYGLMARLEGKKTNQNDHWNTGSTTNTAA